MYWYLASLWFAELLAPALCGRTVHRLLHARRLASSTSRELPRAPLRPPCPSRRFDSAVGVWRSVLVTDCSALLTLRSCWSWVTPSHGSLRVQHLELCTACELLRTRYPGILIRRRIAPPSSHPPCSGRGLLRFLRLARRAGLRIAPYSDTLRPCDASQIAP